MQTDSADKTKTMTPAEIITAKAPTGELDLNQTYSVLLTGKEIQTILDIGKAPKPEITEGALKLAKDATRHVLSAICDDPRKYYLMGPMTGSWDKLVAAHAALWGSTKEEIEESYQPHPERYKNHCEEVESTSELMEYCRDYGITLEWLKENRIRANQ